MMRSSFEYLEKCVNLRGLGNYLPEFDHNQSFDYTRYIW